MAENQSCPECGARLPADKPDGPCPVCLLRLGLKESDDTGIGKDRFAPEHIGPYKILDRIGEGGMGDVYLAEQQAPIRRRVAIKVIKRGMDTRQIVARFESERQVLALLNHPNIASVYDAGEHDGRPYFVMEYVAGIPITDYCDRHKLDTQERLALFAHVCDAIQHAHQKGVIHRDLKPGNVLVALRDTKPEPKIIDFGVAKAADQHLTEKTLFTQHGVLIGTPEYMSPEQAELTGLDVDTRTDIYSLGVLLYELLVGALPFDPETLKQAGYDEIRRIIREETPEKPTTRLSGLGQSGATIAERRRTDLKSLGRQIQGDLEWITLKALEKDRARRYPSASEFAADIQRHLNDLPVVAGPPSASYRLAKFVRKNRVPFAAAATVTLTLVILGSTSLWLGSQKQRQALELRASTILASAANAFNLDDWLTSLLLLQELDGLPEPPGAVELALELWGKPIPFAVYRGHDGQVNYVDVDADGNRFVSAAEDGTVRLWSLDSLDNELVLRSDNPLAVPTFASISSNEESVVSVWNDGRIMVHSISGGDPLEIPLLTDTDTSGLIELGPLNEVDPIPASAYLSPNERYLVAGLVPNFATDSLAAINDGGFFPLSPDQPRRIFAAEDGREVMALPTTALALDFSPIDDRMVVGHQDGRIELWPSPESDSPIQIGTHDGFVTSVAFSADGTEIISTSIGTDSSSLEGSSVQIRDIDGTLLVSLQSTPTSFRQPALSRLSPDSEVFAFTGSILETDSAAVYLGQTSPTDDDLPGRTDQFSRAMLELNQGLHRTSGAEFIWSGFKPDGERAMLIGERADDVVIEILDTAPPFATLQRTEVSEIPFDWIPNARFTDQGAIIMDIGASTVPLYRLDQDYGLVLRNPQSRLGIQSAEFSHDGSRVVTAAGDYTARVWDLNGRELAYFDEHAFVDRNEAEEPSEAFELFASFSPDDSLLLTVSPAEGVAIVRPVEATGPARRFEIDEARITRATFSPDGEILLTGATDGVARLFDIADGTLVGEIGVYDGELSSAHYSPDGSAMVLTSRASSTVYIVDVDTLDLRRSIAVGQCEPVSAEYHPDGEDLLIGCANGNVRLFPPDGSQPPVEFAGAPRPLEGVRFSPDGSRIVAAPGGFGRLVFWDVDHPDEPTVAPIGATNAIFSPDNRQLLVSSVFGGNLIGYARLIPVTWTALLLELRTRTTACLTAAQRSQFLAEDSNEALEKFLQCEAAYGR